MNRRAFLAGLFAGIAGAKIGIPFPEAVEPIVPPLPAEPLVIPSGPWFRPYCYYFRAELRGQQPGRFELIVPRPFLINHVSWLAPEGARVKLYDADALLASCDLPPGASVWPLMPSVALPPGESFTVDLINRPDNFLMHTVTLMLGGVQEITEADAIAARTEVDAEFTDDDGDDEWE